MELSYEDINIKPFAYAFSLIEGKWKMHILFWLWKTEVMRYSELKRALQGVTHKMLSNKLKELEVDGLFVMNIPKYHQKLNILYLTKANHLCLFYRKCVNGVLKIYKYNRKHNQMKNSFCVLLSLTIYFLTFQSLL